MSILRETMTFDIPLVQPGDRVIHAERWQGTLDSPAAENPINDALFVAELADWFDTAPEPSEDDVTWLNAHPILPPIAGGAPDVEAFEPSPADWDDFARWSGALTDDDVAAAGSAVG